MVHPHNETVCDSDSCVYGQKRRGPCFAGSLRWLKASSGAPLSCDNARILLISRTTTNCQADANRNSTLFPSLFTGGKEQYSTLFVIDRCQEIGNRIPRNGVDQFEANLSDGKVIRCSKFALRAAAVPRQKNDPAKNRVSLGFGWWAWQGSNLRPDRYERPALTN